MSYFEEIVAEYVTAERSRFISPGFSLDLDGGGPHAKGRNWWIDVMAVDFNQKTVFLCEVSYSKTLSYMFKRLSLWSANWDAINEAVFEITKIESHWKVKPWIFTPRDSEKRFKEKVAALPSLAFNPDWTAMEDTLPWTRDQLSRKAALARREGQLQKQLSHAEIV